jgi:hypothetical protein
VGKLVALTNAFASTLAQGIAVKGGSELAREIDDYLFVYAATDS